MKDLWDRLETWATTRAKRSLRLRKAISTKEIIAAEKAMKLELPADFRESLAVDSQMTMDNFIDPESVVTDRAGRPWACIAHMPAERHADTPGILQVAFPMPNGRWEDYIDLYYEIPELRGHATSDYVLNLREEYRKRAMGF